jgi:hypothetical protein
MDMDGLEYDEERAAIIERARIRSAQIAEWNEPD